MEPKDFKARIAFKDGEEGAVSALFSHFNSIDQSGDVVLPSFFTDGQAIPMAAWGHDWGSLPPGKGVIRVTPEGAVFEGNFFLNTPQGKAHYETVKAMGDLQEWSFGFRVLAANPGVKDGKEVRFLEKGETFEASPVLVGDNRNTYTAAIKSGTPLGEHSDVALAAVSEFVARAKARADVREKEGRVLSRSNRDQLGAHLAELRRLSDEIEALLDATDPDKDRDEKAAALAAVIDAELTLARLSGVAV
jgi:HK97 family phage prohead protease